MPKRRLALIAAAVIAVGACAQTATTAEGEFAFGSPADPGNADRVIEVRVGNDLSFDPAELRVSPGETITFRVVNEGALAHDFTIGDEATQAEHAEEMADGMAMHADPNAVFVGGGETKELTWRFEAPGTVLVGCHQPGHYEAGMRAAITVQP